LQRSRRRHRDEQAAQLQLGLVLVQQASGALIDDLQDQRHSIIVPRRRTAQRTLSCGWRPAPAIQSPVPVHITASAESASPAPAQCRSKSEKAKKRTVPAREMAVPIQVSVEPAVIIGFLARAFTAMGSTVVVSGISTVEPRRTTGFPWRVA